MIFDPLIHELLISKINLLVIDSKHNYFQVDLNREITFCHSKQKFTGVPIMASNMDTVGTFEMAVALAEVSNLCPV